MATNSPWKCSSCGYENSAFDTECLVCKQPRPSSSSIQSAGSSSSIYSGSSREHMTTSHYIVMILLMIGAVLFCAKTPLGNEIAGSIHIGLVMDFATRSFGDLVSDWSGLATLLVIGGGIIGLCCAGGGGAAAGAICGYLLHLLICFIWMLLVSYVFPFIVNTGAFVSVGAICLAFALGCAVAIVNYAKKFFLYLNPYPTSVGVYDDGNRRYYQDKHKNREEYGRRSYFFGPGFFSIKETIRNSWSANFQLIGNVREWLGDHTDGFVEWLCWIPGLPYFIFFSLSILVVGSAVTIVCSLIHAIPMMIVMLVIDILFSITWLIDRVYLQIHSIKTSCPYDQTRAVIPAFECPACGNKHMHLVPGPYGIWHRRCTCGKVLPTTFLMGRSSLRAFCPNCGNELAASDVQQFAITVVGGTSSGKTVLLSAFYHEFFKKIDRIKNVTYTIPSIHADMFRNLEEWFGGAECGATALGETSDMYSILLKSDVFDVDKQFSLYDIAGEAFEDSAMASMLPQKQMNDSDGIVIVIDPLSALALRNDAKSEGDDTSNYSTAEAAAVITNFVTYLKTVLTNNKIKVKSDKPVAVVITKSDLSSVSRRISYHKIKSLMRSNSQDYESFASARDAVSRDFLIDIGLRDAVNAIEAGFSNVHYFPVSAIGHAANGEEYEPEHVVEPFYWLISCAQPALAELLDIVEE